MKTERNSSQSYTGNTSLGCIKSGYYQLGDGPKRDLFTGEVIDDYDRKYLGKDTRYYETHEGWVYEHRTRFLFFFKSRWKFLRLIPKVRPEFKP